MSQQFEVGDIVAYPQRDFAPVLRSGASWYPDAVVVKTNPLVLVSRRGDMRWRATVQPEFLSVVGKASPELLAAVMHRVDD